MTEENQLLPEEGRKALGWEMLVTGLALKSATNFMFLTLINLRDLTCPEYLMRNFWLLTLPWLGRRWMHPCLRGALTLPRHGLKQLGGQKWAGREWQTKPSESFRIPIAKKETQYLTDATFSKWCWNKEVKSKFRCRKAGYDRRRQQPSCSLKAAPLWGQLLRNGVAASDRAVWAC